jgi:hypothetical protein
MRAASESLPDVRRVNDCYLFVSLTTRSMRALSKSCGNGEQLGYIPAHVSRGGDSSGLASEMDRGRRFQCTIKDLTGGGPGRSLGVNIEITEGDEFELLERPPFAKEASVYSVLSNNKADYRARWVWLFAAVAVLVIIGVIVAK